MNLLHVHVRGSSYHCFCCVRALQLLRRIALEASGAETKVLRQLAKSKGREFLAHFSPTVGSPFGNTPEWDYFR